MGCEETEGKDKVKYRPNLWSTVDRIQCSPDMRRDVYPSDDRKPLVYIPDVRYRKDRELKNAFRS